ncbi:hypothetical protein QYE76_035798 [Lolium multiflorum]|uniref:Uncharacterized protein n=1 Tax=Lolium multiflorum TaxID=4521 RepID=A0AAD8VPC3_LOLMU|nr:hypothetical protein QYE76_035798 [Lolium multiflorum]
MQAPATPIEEHMKWVQSEGKKKCAAKRWTNRVAAISLRFAFPGGYYAPRGGIRAYPAYPPPLAYPPAYPHYPPQIFSDDNPKRDDVSPSNLAPSSPTATTTAEASAAADLPLPRQTPSVSDPRISGDSWPLVERAAILRFVRDGFIIRTPGVAIWNSSVSRFFDLNRNFISESDYNVSALAIGSAREIGGIQILFGPRIGCGSTTRPGHEHTCDALSSCARWRATRARVAMVMPTFPGPHSFVLSFVTMPRTRQTRSLACASAAAVAIVDTFRHGRRITTFPDPWHRPARCRKDRQNRSIRALALRRNPAPCSTSHPHLSIL